MPVSFSNNDTNDHHANDHHADDHHVDDAHNGNDHEEDDEEIPPPPPNSPVLQRNMGGLMGRNLVPVLQNWGNDMFIKIIIIIN